MSHKPKTLAELRSLRAPIRNANKEYVKMLGLLDRLALTVTEKIGTVGFFLLIFLWTIGWISWNIFAPIELRFDPYPAFVLWIFISNMIQILLLPLILVGQNLHGKHTEARAEADFEVNLKAEREIEAIIEHLENQDEMLRQILTSLEKKIE